MKKQRLPKGWTKGQIRELAERHDNLSEEEQAAKVEAALAENGQTVIVVPTRLVPEIERLIGKKSGG